MTGKPDIDPLDALLAAQARQPLAAKFMVGTLAVVAVTLFGWIALALDRQAQAEMLQANGWESLGEVYGESRVSATTETSWDSEWTGEHTVEAVSTYLYPSDDVPAWGERHKALVLQARASRAPDEDGD